MDLQEAIVEEIKNNEVNLPYDKETLASLILYSISQDDYFKDNYHYLTLGKKESGEIKIFQPHLSYIRGFTNQMSSEQIVDFALPKEFWNQPEDIENEYGEYDIYYDESYTSDLETVYLNKNILEDFNKFLNIIENNDNLKNVLKLIEEENKENKAFIHNIERYIGRNFHHDRDSAHKLFKILKNSLFLGEDNNNYSMYSQLYYQDKKDTNNFHPDHFLYRDKNCTSIN